MRDAPKRWCRWPRLRDCSAAARARYHRCVGSRTNTETIVAILKAFLDRRTWQQAELARHVGVSAAAIRKRLGELQTNGVPLESEKEHPHVYWSVPKTWYPGGVLFTSEQVTQVLRLLLRVPRSKTRDQLIDSLIEALPNRPAVAAVVPAESTAREQQHLPIVEDAANQKVVMRFSYFTANRGSETSRLASVQRVRLGPPARFVALCHRTGKLKWFRIDNMSDSKLEPVESFRTADGEQLAEYLNASLEGSTTAALQSSMPSSCASRRRAGSRATYSTRCSAKRYPAAFA
jgi:predicted DNA-binding transcriptional regulator YafY